MLLARRREQWPKQTVRDATGSTFLVKKEKSKQHRLSEQGLQCKECQLSGLMLLVIG